LGLHSTNDAMRSRAHLRDGKPILEFRRMLGRAPVVLEVGAHDGWTTAQFRAAFPRARIIAFEPEPRAIAKFKRRPELRDVTLVERAVGDRNGTVTFHRSGGQAPGQPPGDWDASGSIHPPGGLQVTHPWLTFNSRITVPIVRLDDELARLGIEAIDLIWADVQGAERELILGARETLRRTRYFYTECTETEDYAGQIGMAALCDLLPDFEIVEVFASDLLLRNKGIPPLSLLHRLLSLA